MYIYHKNGIVSSYSEGRNQTPEECLEFDLTDDEKEKLRQNWRPFIKDGKLLFEKSEPVKIEEKRQKIETLKTSVKGAKSVSELKDIINELLNTF